MGPVGSLIVASDCLVPWASLRTCQEMKQKEKAEKNANLQAAEAQQNSIKEEIAKQASARRRRPATETSRFSRVFRSCAGRHEPLSFA